MSDDIFATHIPFTVAEDEMIAAMVKAYMTKQCGWQNVYEYHGHEDCWINGTTAALNALTEAGR